MGCVDQHVIPTRVRRSNLEAPGRRDFELLEHVVGIGPRPLQPGCLAREWGERKEARNILASPRYLTGERTDPRSLSKGSGNTKRLQTGSSASRLQSPCSSSLAS
jgi:hypothetical protein